MKGYPQSGFPDRLAIAERIISADSSAAGVASLVGALGSSIAYTTIFSASRGRLDLMCWALACFLIVVINSAALQLFSLPAHDQIAKIFRMEYVGSVESRIIKFMALVGVPMIAGFILLGLSVVLFDPNLETVVVGSASAIFAAGCLPLAALAYFVLSIVAAVISAAIIQFAPRRLLRAEIKHEEQEHKVLNSFISSVKEKLYFLPEGPGYSKYRERHILLRQPQGSQRPSFAPENHIPI